MNEKTLIETTEAFLLTLIGEIRQKENEDPPLGAIPVSGYFLSLYFRFPLHPEVLYRPKNVLEP